MVLVYMGTSLVLQSMEVGLDPGFTGVGLVL